MLAPIWFWEVLIVVGVALPIGLFLLSEKGQKMFKLEFTPLNGFIVGEQAAGKNGHGFEYSVVKSSFSYGGERGLYEFAGYDEVGEMVHDKVTGWLTLKEATDMAENWKGK